MMHRPPAATHASGPLELEQAQEPTAIANISATILMAGSQSNFGANAIARFTAATAFRIESPPQNFERRSDAGRVRISRRRAAAP
jgi:hypothetical protein